MASAITNNPRKRVLCDDGTCVNHTTRGPDQMNPLSIHPANPEQSDVPGNRSLAVTIDTQAPVEMVEAQSRMSYRQAGVLHGHRSIP